MRLCRCRRRSHSNVLCSLVIQKNGTRLLLPLPLRLRLLRLLLLTLFCKRGRESRLFLIKRTRNYRLRTPLLHPTPPTFTPLRQHSVVVVVVVRPTFVLRVCMYVYVSNGAYNHHNSKALPFI